MEITQTVKEGSKIINHFVKESLWQYSEDLLEIVFTAIGKITKKINLTRIVKTKIIFLLLKRDLHAAERSSR